MAAVVFCGEGGGSVPGAVYANEAEEEKDAQFDGQLYARSAALIDGESGRVLYGKEEDVPRPMASTTKIMTCILALEHMKGDTETAEVSEYAAGQPKVHLGV